jgi:phosphoribosyl-ATP pyrophosphohydrolase
MAEDVLQRLFAVIEARRTEAAGSSYTRQLLDAGPERCARKLGEEAVETLIAALGADRPALVREAADLTYHLLVLLASRGVTLAEVLAELSSRMGTSGLHEKASRGKGAP